MLPELTPPDSVDPDDPVDHNPLSDLPRKTVALWLVVLGLALFLISLLLTAASIRIDSARAQASLALVQATLTVVPTPNLETQQLQASLTQAREAVTAMTSSLPGSQVNWPAVMAAINSYDPTQIELTSLVLADGLLTLGGKASADSVVVAYANALEESDSIARVSVQSIKLLPVPSATVTPSPVSGPEQPGVPLTPTLTFTPTPNLSDPYEVDDFQPKDIFLGEPQSHSFYPVFDVDKVKFLAKAGRFYRVFTADLAPGVDTFLTVNVGGSSFSNDDRQPGDLGSEVTFQAGPDSDIDAAVTITNRGQYGPSQGYQIGVAETVATPTPTAAPTPEPTATPALGDAFEPDDGDAKPIGVGETQSRNFYPEGDVDKVRFLAKSGRIYQVFTSGLVLGVDTALSANVGGVVYTNDDRAPSDLSSAVTFQLNMGADVEVTVTVINRGQYGPEKSYQISVVEQLATPTATPANTETPTPTPTPTPTVTATSTLTPDLRDAYEPDDMQPKTIAVGETQSHNFYPDLDMDMVKLLAKAGNSYQVFTSGLALGVDTVMAINVDGIVYTNDDRQPGDLSSEVTFPVNGANDVEVLITVANRGQYGPDKWYQIVVLEVESLSAAPGAPAAKPPGLAELLPRPLPGSQSRAHIAVGAEREAARLPLEIGPGAVEFVLILELVTGP